MHCGSHRSTFLSQKRGQRGAPNPAVPPRCLVLCSLEISLPGLQFSEGDAGPLGATTETGEILKGSSGHLSALPSDGGRTAFTVCPPTFARTMHSTSYLLSTLASHFWIWCPSMEKQFLGSSRPWSSNTVLEGKCSEGVFLRLLQ